MSACYPSYTGAKCRRPPVGVVWMCDVSVTFRVISVPSLPATCRLCASFPRRTSRRQPCPIGPSPDPQFDPPARSPPGRPAVTEPLAHCSKLLRVKASIHPDYALANVHCSCGNQFYTRSTKDDLHVELCSECHPFYTGKQKLVDTGGRVERFQRRAAKHRAGRR